MNEIDMNRFFDDIEGAIEMLENQLRLQCEWECNSEYEDALKDRIKYLKERQAAGDLWVDNDTTASPDAWKRLETYTEAEAMQKYMIWDA